MFLARQTAILVCILAAICPSESQDPREPPSFLNSLIDHVLVKTGTAINLACIASGQPKPEYRWYHDGQPADTNNFQFDNPGKDGSITIGGASNVIAGQWHCTAENTYGIAMSQEVKIGISVLGSFPPSAAINNYTFNEGQPGLMQCHLPKSIPPAIVKWVITDAEESANVQEVTLSDRVSIDETGGLNFAHFLDTDMREINGQPAIYKCNVMNKVEDWTKGGSYGRLKIVRQSPISDREPAVAYKTTSPKVALVGLDVEFKCGFSGRPTPKVVWAKKNGNLQTGRISYSGYGTILEISNVQASDAGLYTCTGSSTVATKVSTGTIEFVVEEKPRMRDIPIDMVVAKGSTAVFKCSASGTPTPTISWYVNAKPVDRFNPGPRRKISNDQSSFEIHDVCKDCVGSSTVTDLMVVQCVVSNKHAERVNNAYLNVVDPVMFTIVPEDRKIQPDDIDKPLEVLFEVDGKADPFQKDDLKFEWSHRDHRFVNGDDFRKIVHSNNSLVVNLTGLDMADIADKYSGAYTVKIMDGITGNTSTAYLATPLGPPIATTTAGIYQFWWIFLILAILLLLLILLLCCCLCMQRNKGDTYPVDEKERANGNDPEKELADSGFTDYQRLEDEPIKGSRASLSSTIKMDSDDDGSLAEYGDIDAGKFNEDGSFIGQYMTDKKKKAKDSQV